MHAAPESCQNFILRPRFFQISRFLYGYQHTISSDVSVSNVDRKSVLECVIDTEIYPDSVQNFDVLPQAPC